MSAFHPSSEQNSPAVQTNANSFEPASAEGYKQKGILNYTRPSLFKLPNLKLASFSSGEALPVAGNLSQRNKLVAALESQQRSYQDAQWIFDHIKHYSFFWSFNTRNPNNHLEEDTFIRICERIKYEKLPEGKVLFKQGDTYNDKVYIVYSGNVLLHRKEGGIANSIASLDRSASNPPELSSSRRNSKEGVEVPEHSATARSAKTQHPSLFARRSIHALITEGSANFGDRIQEQFNRLSKMGQLWAQNTEEEEDLTNENMVSLGNEPPLEDGKSEIADDTVNAEAERPRVEKKRVVKKGKSKIKSKADKLKLHLQLQRDLLSSCEDSSADSIRPSMNQFKPDYGQVISTVLTGDFFGEDTLFLRQARDFTAVTGSECELLTISKKDFRGVREEFDGRRGILIDFMCKYIPDFELIEYPDIIDEILSTLQEKDLVKDMVVAREGLHGDHLYVLVEGCCELSKTLKIEEKRKAKEAPTPIQAMVRAETANIREIVVCRVYQGELMGEEVTLTDKDSYDLTIRVVSATAKLLQIKKAEFMNYFPLSTRQKIRKMLQVKRLNHVEIIHGLIAKKYADCEINIQRMTKDNPKFDILASCPIKLIRKAKQSQGPTLSLKIRSELPLANDFNISLSHNPTPATAACNRIEILQSSRSYRRQGSSPNNLDSPKHENVLNDIKDIKELFSFHPPKTKHRRYSKMSVKPDQVNPLLDQETAVPSHRKVLSVALKIHESIKSCGRGSESTRGRKFLFDFEGTSKQSQETQDEGGFEALLNNQNGHMSNKVLLSPIEMMRLDGMDTPVNDLLQQRAEIKTRSIERGDNVVSQVAKKNDKYTFDGMVQKMLTSMQKKKQKRHNVMIKLINTRSEGVSQERGVKNQEVVATNIATPVLSKRGSILKKISNPQLILQSPLISNKNGLNYLITEPDTCTSARDKKLPNLVQLTPREERMRTLESDTASDDVKFEKSHKGVALTKNKSNPAQFATKNNFGKYDVRDDYYNVKNHQPRRSFQIDKLKILRSANSQERAIF